MTNHQSRDILITNYHCASNRGDAAILEGLHAALRKRISGSYTVATEFPSAAKYINGVEVTEQRTSPARLTRPGRNGAYLAKILGLDDLSNRISRWTTEKLNLEPYRKADVVVGTGGHYLTGIYYPGKLGVLWELNYCAELGTPVVLCGQSFGPVERTPYKQLTRRVLNKVDAITVRDRQSKRNLDAIGVETEVTVTADAAFSMELDAKKPLSERRLEKLPQLEGEPTFTISVRHWSHFDEGGMDQYVSSIADLCEHLIETYSGRVYLLSTCTGFDSYHTDDRVTGHEVYDRLSEDAKRSVDIVSGEYTPQELISLFEPVDLHVGTRMHSVVLALLAGTPAVGIEYQFKTTGLFEMFDLERYVLPIERVGSGTLRALVEDGYANRDVIENRIDDRLPDLKERADRNGEIVADVLQSS